MSHGIHTPEDYAHDQTLPPLPNSPDIGNIGRFLVLLAICTSLMQGAFVVGSSHDMHVWPSINSTKVELPPFTPQQQ
jgi:hypothetical protein